MNDRATCKCGHIFADHDTRIAKNPCLDGWYAHVLGCLCEGFTPDNLTMLEEKYEQSQKV
jgi:hypothetical protein